MKIITLISVIVCALLFGLTGTSCSNNPSEPSKPIDTTHTTNPPDTISAFYYADAIPPDCHSWWASSWSGDYFNAMPDFKAIQIWGHIVPINPLAPADSNDFVEIDYFSLVELDTVKKTRQEYKIDYNFYDSPRPLNGNEGGLYDRWYKNDDHSVMKNSLVANGWLKIWPSLEAGKASHFWLFSGQKHARQKNCLYQVECKVKISGNATLIIGGDFWKEVDSAPSGETIKECFHSPWYAPNNDKIKNNQTVVIVWPPIK